jgi:hypothetical protein
MPSVTFSCHFGYRCALFYGFDKSALLVMVFLTTAAAAVLTIDTASLAVTLGSCQTPRG